MRQSLRRKAPWAIAALVVLAIIAGGTLLAGSLRAQRDSGAEVTRRFQNVLTLRRTLRLLVDAETGQRGFLLTGNAQFLEPYEAARRELPADLNRLVRVGMISPTGLISRKSSIKLGELERTIALVRAGRRAEAIAIVASETGKQEMDSIRREVAALTRVQQRLIDTSIRHSEQSTGRTYVLLAFLAACAFALVAFGLLLALRSQRLESETERLRSIEVAERRSALIARELNHRVKNLFAVVIAIIQLASRGSTSPKDAVARITERVQALSRAHEISLGHDPMDGFDLETLLRATLAPYAGGDYLLEIDGPPVELPAMRVTPLGLIVHELATNALKHGAWSAEGGTVSVRWSVAPGAGRGTAPARHDLLRLSWTEHTTTPLPPEGGSGFGSRMIGAAVGQLDGSFKRDRSDGGLSFILDAPIIPAQSSPPAEASNAQ